MFTKLKNQTILFILLLLPFCSLHSHELDSNVLFHPQEFEYIQEFETTEIRDLNAPDGYLLKFNEIVVYERNDSLLLNYLRRGEYQEFLAPDILSMIRYDQVVSLELIEDNGSAELFLIKMFRYEARFSSAWSNWFHNTHRWAIIDFDNHSIVFDFIVKELYHEEIFSYDGDLDDESLSEEEIKKMINNRQTETTECRFEYDITIKQNKITAKHIYPPIEVGEMCSSIDIVEGTYEWSGKEYVKKKEN